MAMDSAASPSSSPISVAIHQESTLRQRSPPADVKPIVGGSGKRSTRRELLLTEDTSSDCSTANPQQGTTTTTTTSMHSISSDLEGMRTIDERPSRNSMQQRQGGGGASRTTGHHHNKQAMIRPKRPPRLIDTTRPTMKIPPTHKDNRKLFVGGLPLDVTYEEFYRYFVRHGVILDSVVMFDKATQRCRGFGFVTFEDPQVCADLLRLGGAEEATSEGTGSQNGYLEMRGKVIEIKRAQPKSASSPGGSPSSSEQSSTHSGAVNNNRRLSENAKSYSPPHPPCMRSSGPLHSSHQPGEMRYGLHMTHEQQQQQQQHHHHHHPPMMNHQIRPFVPATPMPMYSNDLSGSSHSHHHPHHHRAPPPMTPQQAVLDLAHHMLFYSQLLATPTLMSHHLGMVSPMMSPNMMGVQAYSDYFQPFYDENATHSLSPAPPPNRLRKVPEGESFEIGGGKFFRETPLSPTLDDSSQPSLRPPTDHAKLR